MRPQEVRVFVDHSFGERRFLPANRKSDAEVDPRYVNYEIPVKVGSRILVRTDFKPQYYSGFHRIVKLALENFSNESASISFCFDNKGRVMRILIENRNENDKKAKLQILRAGKYKDTSQKAPIWFRNEQEYITVSKEGSQQNDVVEGIEPYFWRIGLGKLLDNAQQMILEEGLVQQVLLLERVFNPQDRFPRVDVYYFKKLFYYMGIAMYPLLSKKVSSVEA